MEVVSVAFRMTVFGVGRPGQSWRLELPPAPQGMIKPKAIWNRYTNQVTVTFLTYLLTVS
ncbi:hypothetical protein ART_2203 [Arthrobacter sp. PAMC 25486]|nr:hypothetical protein ART_2203 [Arthrobacter sp. PAMC 25486]